jgi:signal transduction histidine kinase
MKSGTVAILILGFGTLVALVAVLGFSAYHRAARIESEIASIHESYRQNAFILSQTKEDAYLSGLMIRDYLLDPSPAVAPRYKQELLEIRTSLANHLDSLDRLSGIDESKVLNRLRHELDVYWDLLDPVFEWTPKQKAALAYSFLRREVIPHRNAVLSIMREVDDLSDRSFKKEQQSIRASREEFQGYLQKMIGVSVCLALGVALISIFRVSVLERRSENQRQRAENAEKGLRQLSHQLVQAQEEERKSISRELHDEIGQLLTGLKMELANLEEFRDSPGDEFAAHLTETKNITKRAMQSVRDLAMGLRPSMLDDLGLEPALRWQAGEFSRLSGIPVTIETDGNLLNLTDPVRTCIYRVVQESLTNCARHSEAKNVRIAVHGGRDRISLTIKDDGRGFDVHSIGGRGFGLIGMEERVRKLGGVLSISSRNREEHAGTVLNIELPAATETS